MRVTILNKNKNNHLIYQFQLILCLQRVVTEGYKSDALNLNIQYKMVQKC